MHPAVDGFETVSDVGQCTSDDDGHRVVEVGPFHFGLEVDLVVRRSVAGRLGPLRPGGGCSGGVSSSGLSLHVLNNTLFKNVTKRLCGGT